MMPIYQIILIEKLKPSSLNPRHYINEAKMNELTESIRKVGIRVPLLVRPYDGYYEIAAGHRRLQAAQAVGLKTVPVLIQEMNDTEFLELLTFENLHHEDIHPLDEANGYRTLIDKAGYDVAAIAARLGKGKSESYIYQRLKLLDLIPEAKELFFKEVITAGHAILIARLQEKDQKQILKEGLYDSYWDGGRQVKTITSVRQMAHYINQNIHLDLNSASFSKKDPDLLPSAGPCTICLKRTGFLPQLFPDIKKDTCTDRTCFHAKIQAFMDQWIQEQSQNTDVSPLRLSQAWDGRVKKLPDDLTKPITRDLYHEIEGKKDSCNSVREGIVIDGHERGQIKKVCVDPKCERHHGRQSSNDPGMKIWKAQQKAAQEKKKIEETIRFKILDAILSKSKGDLSKQDLIFIAQQLFDELCDEYRKKILSRHDIKPIKQQYGYDQITPMKKFIEDCHEKEINKLLMEMAMIRNIVPRWDGAKRPDILLTIADRYGVDPKAIGKEVTAIKEKKKAKEKKVQTSAKSKKRQTKGEGDGNRKREDTSTISD
jgi:ParB family chromosome partitioning protein